METKNNVETTCKLVYDVVEEAVEAVEDGKHVLYIGAPGHPEPLAVISGLPEGSYTFIDYHLDEEAPKLRDPLVYGEDDRKGEDKNVPLANMNDYVVLNQTTLSTIGIIKKVEQLREVNPHADIPDPIGLCYATDNRQNAVRERLRDKEKPTINAVFVVGSPDLSHNSLELSRVAMEEEFGIDSHLVDTPDQIDPTTLTPDKKRVLITSGASVLDPYLWEVVYYFTSRGARVEFLANTERKPKIDPDTKKPLLNPDTGEAIYKDATFPLPDLTPVWERYAIVA